MHEVSIQITVNDKVIEKNIMPNVLLIDFLREELKLTGSHVGCDTSQCGACMVFYDETAIMAKIQLNGKKISTIENLEKDGVLHPMQEAFRNNHGLQCGFCTPGMIISAISLVKENNNPDESTITKTFRRKLM